MDRREGRRLRTIYWPALIENAGRLSFAIMRNVSHEGASFVGVSGVRAGDTISYKVANSEKIVAEVIWTDGDRIGVRNNSAVADLTFSLDQPYRSVRLPIEAPISVFKLGTELHGQLKNLSQRGACIAHNAIFSAGEYLTLKIGKITIEKVTVVWTAGDAAGLRFSHALQPEVLRQVLDILQQNMSQPSSLRSIAA